MNAYWLKAKPGTYHGLSPINQKEWTLCCVKCMDDNSCEVLFFGEQETWCPSRTELYESVYISGLVKVPT